MFSRTELLIGTGSFPEKQPADSSRPGNVFPFLPGNRSCPDKYIYFRCGFGLINLF